MQSISSVVHAASIVVLFAREAVAPMSAAGKESAQLLSDKLVAGMKGATMQLLVGGGDQPLLTSIKDKGKFAVGVSFTFNDPATVASADNIKIQAKATFSVTNKKSSIYLKVYEAATGSLNGRPIDVPITVVCAAVGATPAIEVSFPDNTAVFTALPAKLSGLVSKGMNDELAGNIIEAAQESIKEGRKCQAPPAPLKIPKKF